MSDRVPFLAYVRDFELAFVTDDWSRIEPHFQPDACRIVHTTGMLSADDRGREAAVAGLRDGVYALDRRFDARIAEVVEGPVVREDGLFMRWRLRFVRSGLPELAIDGAHLAVYRDGLIERIEEWVEPAEEARAEAFLAEHDAALRPAGSPWSMPGARDVVRIEEAMARSMVRGYAAAKSQQDVEGALAGCAPDFAIDTVPFGFDTGDRESTAPQLGLFFQAFPDYAVETDGLAVDGGQVAWWGRFSVTSGGPLLGIPATGRRATLPACSVFELRGAELVRERFNFDLAALCEGLGLPVDRVVDALAPLRRRAAA